MDITCTENFKKIDIHKFDDYTILVSSIFERRLIFIPGESMYLWKHHLFTNKQIFKVSHVLYHGTHELTTS